MIIKINGVEPGTDVQSVSALPTKILNASYSTEIAASVPWWDIKGQLELAADGVKEAAADFFTEVILGFLEALVNVIADLSYAAALLGGGIFIIVRAFTGIKKADQYMALLFLIHVLITFLLA